MYKIFVFLCLIIPFMALASEEHHSPAAGNMVNESQYHIVNINKMVTVNVHNDYHRTINQYSRTALALSAAQLTFDAGTTKSQVSMGLGSFNGSQALSVGLGKKVNSFLLNGSISVQDDQVGYGAGLSFKF